MTTIFDEAERLVTLDRQSAYGHPAQCMKRISDAWSAYVGTYISPRNVCAMMVLVKLVRDQHETKRDNLVDIAGYARCMELMEVGTSDPD